MTDFSESDAEPSVDPAASRRLFILGCVALAVAVLAFWLVSPLTDILQLLAGVSILVLGCLPGLLWARHNRPWFPCFEISTLTCVVFYAIPLLNRHEDLNVYADSTLEISGWLVVAYLGAAVVVFNSVRNPREAPYWAAQKLLPDDMLRYVPAGLLINTAYIALDRFTTIIPYDIAGSVRALCFGLGTVTAFIFACEWGRGRLSRGMKVLFISCLAIQVILLFSHLYLITGMSLLILSGIGYTSTRRHLPWLAIAICLPVIAVLHNGKSEMRKLYWGDSGANSTFIPSIGDLPSLFSQWIDFGLHPKNEGDADTNIATKLAERASLFQMLCLSVDQIPDHRPYLDGVSYVDIPAQVVPRILWPDKPSSLLSNIRLAVYFNLVDPDNAFSTSIAFGMIAEAYINFGFWGVLVLGALTGLAFKHISLRSIGTPMFSAIGIFMILLTAWSFQAEQVMATWLSSLFQAGVVSIGVPLAFKKFFGSV